MIDRIAHALRALGELIGRLGRSVVLAAGGWASRSRRTIARVAAVAVMAPLMVVGLTATAQADSLKCNLTGGSSCGRVINMGQYYPILIHDDRGRTVVLNPGDSSRHAATWMRDVREWSATRHTTLMWNGAVTTLKPGRYAVSDSPNPRYVWTK